MNYYIVTVNDIIVDSKDKINIDAITIINKLVNKEIWIFKKDAPYIRRFKKNDIILIYICGKNRRYFFCEIEFKSEPKPFNKEIENIAKDLGILWMSMYVDIKKLKIFQPPIKLLPLVESLTFIKDKKYFGLTMRRSVIEIPKQDYKLIIKQINNVE